MAIFGDPLAGRLTAAPRAIWLLIGLLLMSRAVPGTAQTAPIQPVRIASSLDLASLPTLVAAEAGLFVQHRLDAEISFDSSDERSLQRARSGEVDFALMTLAPLVVDYLADSSRGGLDDPVILAGLIHPSDIHHIVFLNDRAIDEPSDLSGRRIALPAGADAEFFWWLFSTINSLTADVHFLHQQSAAEIPELLATGSIDAAVIQAPWLTKLDTRLERELGRFSLSQLYAAKRVLVTSRQTASQRPDLCNPVLATYRDAIRLIREHPAQALALYAERMGLSMPDAQSEWPVQVLDYELSIDWSLIAALQQQAYWASARQGQPSQVVDVIDLIDDSVLHSLLPGAVDIPPAAPRSR